MSLSDLISKPDLVAGVTHIYLRSIGSPTDIPAPETSVQDRLVRDNVISGDCRAISDNFGPRRAYACLEWYRQIQKPDYWSEFLGRVSIRRKSVLDIGCGPGVTVAQCIERGAASVVGLDSDIEYLSIASELIGGDSRASLCNATAERLPIRDQSFDVVVCRVALNYMPLDTVISEVARVLKRDGTFCVIVHGFWYYYRMLFANPRRRAYGLSVIKNGLVRLVKKGERERFLAVRPLSSAARRAGLHMQEHWSPASRSDYFGAVFRRS
ncbi:MAG: class I SAM-dependent methyltransferase [Gammaproteobacteria bacterium]|nr:class I SAM-dependent methyltransferase [Gammaproteobacteria bacterium]